MKLPRSLRATSVLACAALGLLPGFPLAAATPPAPRPNHVTGRVTLPDGQPIRGDVRDVTVAIQGITEAGQNVTLTPVVKDDGSYVQRVTKGLYAFSGGEVKLGYNGVEFVLPLEPVGRFWQKRREADEGIVQDFVLRYTGPNPAGQAAGLDPQNATHWYGVSFGLQWQSYRQDTKRVTKAPVGVTTLVFTCRATGPSLDGAPVAPITRELRWDPGQFSRDFALHDLPPANYELSGVATLPDGTRKPLLLLLPAESPNFTPVLKTTLRPDRRPFRFQKAIVGFVIE